MKPLYLIILGLFLNSSLWAASQMYSVTNVGPMVIRAKLPHAKPEDLKIQVIDVVSGHKATIYLNPVPNTNWFESRYQIDIRGKSGELPILQFSYNGKILFLRSLTTPKNQILGLFESEIEAAPPAPTAASKLNALATAKAQAAKVPVAINAKAQETEQLGLEAQEALRREALMRQHELMSAQDKQKRADKSAELIASANAAYAKGDYDTAVAQYAEALELDPNNSQGYYNYSVSLYKTGQYNKSLAMLAMADGGDQSQAESDYYTALNHLKLKDYDKALRKLHDVRDEEDAALSPLASFLAGNVEFQQQKYAEARKSFEYTIDKSTDPEMDKQSEAMLEQIDQIENFNASSREKLKYTLSAGLSYDGDVLNISQQNLATDVAAYRLSYSGSLLYKLFQTFKSEWDATLTYSDIYSLNKSFSPDSTLQSADPLTMSLSLPYRNQITLFNQGFQWNVTPTYSSLTMNAENNQRKPIIQSLTLGSDISYQRNAKWIAAYKVELNQDTSFLTTSAADDNQSSLRTTVGTTQTKLLDPKATRTWGGDLSLALNAAKGKNNNYQKAILGTTYTFPGRFDTQSTVRGEYTNISYSDNSNQRKDSTISLTAGASKTLKKNLSLSLSLQYVTNASNVDSNKYDKFVATSLLTYTGALWTESPPK